MVKIAAILNALLSISNQTVCTAVSNESIDFAVFRILQEEGKTTGA